MLASTPVRVAIVVATLAGLVVGYRWWNSPERYINRMLSDISSVLSHEGAETDVRALASVAALQTHLRPDVSIDLGRGSPIRGRQEAIAMATRVRVASPVMRLQFFDPEITLSDESSGTTLVTVQITTRDPGGQEIAAAHVVSMELVRAEGRWQIASARVLPEDTPL
jgi:SnoaL-like domain